MTGLIDTHCHLDSRQFDGDREEVIERAFSSGVEYMVAIGTGEGPRDLEAGIRLAEKYQQIYCTVGIHPHHAAKAIEGTLAALEALLGHPKVLAVGETGLDYHYNFSPGEQQREVFVAQLEIAKAANKPVVIHTREAWDDTFEILERHYGGAPAGGIMHCFSGGEEEMRRSIALGFHISFTGVVTFPKALAVQAAARAVPLERLLVETDAPYLAPVPHRGKRNEPAFLRQTAIKLAELRETPVEVIAAAVSANFWRLAGKPPGPPIG